jgi:benzoate-CoA ligase family protein
MRLSATASSNNAASFFVDRHVHNGNGEQVAIYSCKQNITYASLAKSVNKIGNYLLKSGTRPEQRVALMLPDSPEFIYCFMAVLKIGAVAVPLNTFCNTQLLKYYLNDSRAETLIAHSDYSSLVLSIQDVDLPYLRRTISYEDLENNTEPDALNPYPLTGDDNAFWLYTSGSEGLQKGVMHRHASMRICAKNYGRGVLRINDNDRVFSTSKMFFAYGLGNSIIFPFSVGASSILIKEKCDPATVRDVIKRFKPTLFFSVPMLYKRLLNDNSIQRELFESVRMCISAGEYLPESIFEAWEKEMGQVIYDGIGSTEAMHIFCSNRIDAYRAGTSGMPVQGYELKVVDDEGNPVALDRIGRLMVRGKTLAKGYWNRYDLSQKAFHGEWLVTGDLYRQSIDGYYKYIGRQGDMFKSSGLWVSPIEIEQVILSHEDVAEAAVVASRNLVGFFVAKAYVVARRLAPDQDINDFKRCLYSYLEKKLSRYKIPESIDVVPCLPTTATGKIARAELRKMT